MMKSLDSNSNPKPLLQQLRSMNTATQNQEYSNPKLGKLHKTLLNPIQITESLRSLNSTLIYPASASLARPLLRRASAPLPPTELMRARGMSRMTKTWTILGAWGMSIMTDH